MYVQHVRGYSLQGAEIYLFINYTLIMLGLFSLDTRILLAYPHGLVGWQVGVWWVNGLP